MPPIQYGPLAGNAFSLFEDLTGTGVEVVAFGPTGDAVEGGLVFKNFTDDPIYGIDARGDLRGDRGSLEINVQEETIAQYAVPAGGLAIQSQSDIAGDGIGENAELDVRITYSETPARDGPPQLPMPINAIQREGNVITADVTNTFPFPIYGAYAELVCLDDERNVTNGTDVRMDGGGDGNPVRLDPVLPGGSTFYPFQLTGPNTECTYFLISAAGIDATEARYNDGTDSIPNTPQVASQSSSDRPVGPAADYSVFSSCESAQAYYREHSEEQATIDPDADGLACEVYFDRG